MVLASAIKFRWLVEQLDNAEKNEFISKFLLNNSNDIVIRAIFNLFAYDQSSTKVANNSNYSISKMIESRKNKKEEKKMEIKLDCLPKPLIGKTASFLLQNDYISLSKCNRFTYLGSNSPNLLQEVELNIVSEFPACNLALYRSAKTLVFDLNNFNDLKLPKDGSSVMNHLENMVLCGTMDNELEIDKFVANNQLNTQNIKKLTLIGFGNVDAPIDSDKFYKVLEKFPAVEHMALMCNYTNDLIDGSRIKALCPKLTGFESLGEPVAATTSIVETYGNLWQCLSLDATIEEENDNFSKNDFGKLEELSLIARKYHVTKVVLKSAVNLKRIFLRKCAEESPVLKHTEDLLAALISNCKSLEYLEFDDYTNDAFFEPALTGLGRGLSSTMNIKRDRLKIRMTVGAFESSNNGVKLENILPKLQTIVRCLQESNIKHFMFIVHLNNWTESLNEWLKSKMPNANVVSVEGMFVMTNENCSLCIHETMQTMDLPN